MVPKTIHIILKYHYILCFSAESLGFFVIYHSLLVALYFITYVRPTLRRNVHQCVLSSLVLRAVNKSASDDSWILPRYSHPSNMLAHGQNTGRIKI